MILKKNIKILVITISLSFLLINSASAQQQTLFRIVQNERVGYINNQGKEIIAPQFLNGNEFSDGLAAVRKNGLYGYIDSTGTFIINPQFDYAENFYSGITIVFKKGVPYFIDKRGNQLLDTLYRSLFLFDDHHGIIKTRAGKYGVLDINSFKLVIDTLYDGMQSFKNGVSVVSKYKNTKKNNYQSDYAVIDILGNIIVPFGKYIEIKSYTDGNAIVQIENKKNKEGDDDGVIDNHGNLLFVRHYKNNTFMQGDFHNGFASINLYKYWIPEKKGIISTSDKDYDGFINLKGEIVFDDTNYIRVKDFSDNRVFVQLPNYSYILLDTSFKRVGNESFDFVLNNGFVNGFAVVNNENGWGIIDANGSYVVEPFDAEITDLDVKDSCFFYTKYIDSVQKKLYGIKDLKGKDIFQCIINQFDDAGFNGGLLQTYINKKQTYINRNGVIVWQAKNDLSPLLKPLNIDHMNRGYFYAYSSPGPETESGGWYAFGNIPKKITSESFIANSISVSINDKVADTFAMKYNGHPLYISNTTNDTVCFNAQDSRLYMKLQALDSQGVWRYIEYLPSSWCGNSYHVLKLEPNAYWKFTIPNYTGEFETKIRAELYFIDKNEPKKDKIIYSNIIDASINPGQFWNKMSYTPSGIMDPYVD